MRYILPDNTLVQGDKEFRIGSEGPFVGDRLSVEDRARLNVRPLLEGLQPDQFYYWVAEVIDYELATATYVGTPKDLAGLKLQIIARVKFEANTRILNFMPDWVQRNTLANGILLLRQKLVALQEWTPAQLAQIELSDTAWGKVQVIRGHSNVLEAEIKACGTVAEL